MLFTVKDTLLVASPRSGIIFAPMSLPQLGFESEQTPKSSLPDGSLDGFFTAGTTVAT